MCFRQSVLSFQTIWTLNGFLSQQLEEIKTLQEFPKTRKSVCSSQRWWWRRGLERVVCLMDFKCLILFRTKILSFFFPPPPPPHPLNSCRTSTFYHMDEVIKLINCVMFGYGDNESFLSFCLINILNTLTE